LHQTTARNTIPLPDTNSYFTVEYIRKNSRVSMT